MKYNSYQELTLTSLSVFEDFDHCILSEFMWFNLSITIKDHKSQFIKESYVLAI